MTSIKRHFFLINNFKSLIISSSLLMLRLTGLLILLLCRSANGDELPSSKTLTIASDYWCPYSCYADDKEPGFLIELFIRSMKLYDIEVKYILLPRNQLLEDLKNGKVDAISGITEKNIRETITTSKPIEYAIISSFTRTGTDWLYDEPESLRGKKLGILTEYMNEEIINNYVGSYYLTNSGKFEMGDGEMASKKLVNDLLNGKIDVYMEDERVMDKYMREGDLYEKIRNAGKLNKAKLPIYILFSQKSPNAEYYVKYLEQGIEVLKLNGDYDALRRKYHINNQENKNI